MGKGPYGPSSGPSCLLHLQWPLITNVIETPDFAGESSLWEIHYVVYLHTNDATIVHSRDVQAIQRNHFKLGSKCNLTPTEKDCMTSPKTFALQG